MTQTGVDFEEEFRTRKISFGPTNSASIELVDALPEDIWVFRTDNVDVKQLRLESETIFIDATKNGGTPTINTFADETEFKFKENSRPWLTASFDDLEVFIGNLSEPIKKMIGDVNNLRMKHTNNSLFTEQVSGVDTKEDGKNDYMFVKPQGQDSKRKKVDACVAWSMAKCLRLQAEAEIDWDDFMPV